MEHRWWRRFLRTQRDRKTPEACEASSALTIVFTLNTVSAASQYLPISAPFRPTGFIWCSK